MGSKMDGDTMRIAGGWSRERRPQGNVREGELEGPTDTEMEGELC